MLLSILVYLCSSLRPLVEELKAVRKQCMEVEAEYQEKKGAHEKVGGAGGGSRFQACWV